MKTKKIPLRKCVVTNERLEKKELIRVVRTPEGTFVVDITGKMNGKGAYLKRDIEVIKKAKNNKVLNRVFETELDEVIYDELIEKIK